MLSFSEPSDLHEYLDMMESMYLEFMADHPEITADMLSPPNCFIATYSNGLVVIGEAVAAFPGEEHQVEMNKERGYVWGHWYSVLHPYGIARYIHRSKLVPVSRESYDRLLDSLHRITNTEEEV